MVELLSYLKQKFETQTRLLPEINEEEEEHAKFLFQKITKNKTEIVFHRLARQDSTSE